MASDDEDMGRGRRRRGKNLDSDSDGAPIKTKKRAFVPESSEEEEEQLLPKRRINGSPRVVASKTYSTRASEPPNTGLPKKETPIS